MVYESTVDTILFIEYLRRGATRLLFHFTFHLWPFTIKTFTKPSLVMAPNSAGLLFFIGFSLSHKVLYFYNPSSITPSETTKPNTTVLWVMWNTTPGLCPISARYLWNKTITNSLHHHKHPHKTFTPDEATRNPLSIGQPAVSREQETSYHWLLPASNISTGNTSSCIDPESSSPLAEEGGLFCNTIWKGLPQTQTSALSTKYQQTVVFLSTLL